MTNFAKNVVSGSNILITDSSSTSSAEVQQIVISKPNLEMKLMKLSIDSNLASNIDKLVFKSSDTTTTTASSSTASPELTVTTVKLTASALNMIKAQGD